MGVRPRKAATHFASSSLATRFAWVYGFPPMFGDDKLRKRVSELEESFERIEHSFRKLQVEWTETYDKFRQLHWRVAKRAKQLEENTADSAEVPTSPPGDQDFSGADVALPGLTPQQIEAQRKILSRRMRGRLPTQ